MANCIDASGESGDLFGEVPIARPGVVTRRSLAPALKTARLLCRQLRHNRARPEKQRIAHLICLDLLSMLRRGPQR